ncbi:MAG: ATPase, T2SS/T4P/T4SS family [Candidatus Altiarchaeota archaeon]|nr:ATPase, T2SS/T4P/T4SS family [Candidatus Altiarchaeota archaeon]
MVEAEAEITKGKEKETGKEAVETGGKGKEKETGKEAVDKNDLVVDSYDIHMDDLSFPVTVVDVGDYVLHYKLTLPDIDFVTAAFLDDSKRSLVQDIQIETRNILDPDSYAGLKDKFLKRSKEKLRGVLKKLSEEDLSVLSRVIVNDMVGLGDIEYLLADSMVEEVVVNSSKDVIWIYHKVHGWLKTNIIISSEDMIMNYSSRIAREVGREISHLVPLLDAHLVTGDRVNSTLFPISTTGNTITIRRFSRTPWTIVHLISPKFKTISTDAAAFLWLAIEYEMNMLVAGGTASGKTSMLNAMMPFFPANQRIISIEDTRELNLPDYLHWVPLNTRLPTPQGEGEVSMLDLVENSLRMRPDRIVVGEVRRQREAEVLFEAMHTGHSVYGTFHALGAGEVVERISSPPMSIPPMVMGSLHMVVTQYINRRTKQRRTFEIAELIRKGSGAPEVNIIYKWQPRTDTVKKVSSSIRLQDELETFTGMTEKEIAEDLTGKENILNWLLRRDIKDVNDVGKIIAEYYLDKETVLDLVEHDKEI